MEDIRVTPEDYFFTMAKHVSLRATCLRAQVGAILVKDNFIVTSGYNGSESGSAHCSEVGCYIVDGHCERTIHAEINTLLQAAKRGISVDGTVLYSTHRPCYKCSMYLRTCGVKEFKWLEEYKDREGL